MCNCTTLYVNHIRKAQNAFYVDNVILREMKEIWKDITGYEDLYQVSNTGQIRSNDRTIVIPPNPKSTYGFNYIKKGRTIKQVADEAGYMKVLLYDTKGLRKNMFVHRLVAMEFIDNPNNLLCINHKDENKSNNCVDNLEWCTVKYNTNYGTGIKRRSEKQIYSNSKAKAVIKIGDNGETLEQYVSMRNAARINKLPQSNIFKSCNNNIKCGGYLWRYVEE